ncbi:TlpA family protein disulfide reductase [Micromonospora endolithica]|uniref:TlpA family protein disulfide reductase n=1 Tax=Micromonospora endolithica TaxID=230091 RepID=A0A3A9Z3D3_9ACTN|nr:TlpA disulfide reductase family protein [Micromonospora endolithica]RKN42745.1 TlpA family protein disulfide reductase [Micromonospora endolithica]TWJ25410.1 thiol-disulfide isomerase/thioredoxin [Micromonospora endolithica]
MRKRLVLLLVPALLAVAGCTADTDTDTGPATTTREKAASSRPSPFADCADLGTPPASADLATPPSSALPESSRVPGVGKALPELTLTCFTGGDAVALPDLRGPAVINVWASWCPPCRKELPAFQRLSERTAGQLRVVGVNSRDGRGAAQSFGEDFGVRFPMLFDQGEAFQRALERNAIPLTVLVDGQGIVRHVDASGALDDARLAELVRRHLGVAVPA